MVTTPPRHPNVVVIVADTLRRDRPGIYGGPAVTPNLDAFGQENLVFDAAVSQAPWTKPSIATLFTGVYPSQHGVITHPNPQMGGARDQVLRTDGLSEGWSTMAETFSGHGYRTGAIVTNPWMQHKLGFAQGFEFYDISMARAGGPGERVAAAGLEWLERSADRRPFFLYLHFMDAHPPYAPLAVEVAAEYRGQLRSDRRRLPPFQRQRLGERIGKANIKILQGQGLPVNLAALELIYDQGVAQFDRALGDFLRGLQEAGLEDQTAVIIASDHGEAMFTRGWFGHGIGLFDDETAAVLVARLPGARSGDRITCPVGLIDVRSTLCDYAGLTCSTDDGISLLSDDQAERGDRLLFSEGVIAKERHRSVRSGSFKLLWQPEGIAMNQVPKWALFDLAADPHEAHNLLGDAELTPEMQAVESRLRAGVAALSKAPRFEPESVELDSDTRQRLQDLGYLGEG